MEALQREIDELYRITFCRVEIPSDQWKQLEERREVSSDIDTTCLSEAMFGLLGTSAPRHMNALLSAKEAQDPRDWQAFQSKVSSLKLRRERVARELQSISNAIQESQRLQRAAVSPTEYDQLTQYQSQQKANTVKIVLITGFESFNIDLYKRAAVSIARGYRGVISLKIFSDRDINSKMSELESALSEADVFFGSLLFDFDQVEWLRLRVARIPVRFVFESSLELMGLTQVGSFQMTSGGQRSGPPPAVKKVLSMFGSGREEDKMVGYLSFLKIGPTLLKFLPGQKAKDLRTWLTVYAYWNQGGLENVSSMVQYLVKECFSNRLSTASGGTPIPDPPPVISTPATGCLHPLAPKASPYWESPARYWDWYQQHGPVQDHQAPVVALLLYRKHVITKQPYILQLIECLESQGIRPIPIFINGVEAHTVVRDQLTTAYEVAGLRSGNLPPNPTLKGDAVHVDAIINTIGFPLVGGPAGTMEGGRQADVAKAILSSKNVPYMVAAPLLIQDMESWVRDGIAGLQSVVLYSLPELDGAIDTIPLGGLVGDNIYLVPERVVRLAGRLKKWISLRKTPPSQRRLGIMLYGFPPGVGAVGTAALLNVPKSLEMVLRALHEEGYDLGSNFALDEVQSFGDGNIGESIIATLRAQLEESNINKGAAVLSSNPVPVAHGTPVAVEISPQKLKESLGFPQSWGPNEWGPIPFLPDSNILIDKMEKAWGALGKQRMAGLGISATGNAVITGLRLGNVYIGVQPLLGVEGDPMRLLFDRDLTPHPQYAAMYRWLQEEFDAVCHFGMHGTVEWLPGAPLGNSGFSWSDILLGNMPNIYVYAANNPSESIIAKRRGYGTIISHNVPPYGRAGLYKQLAELKAVLAEYRQDGGNSLALRRPIVQLLSSTGIENDCPFPGEQPLLEETVEDEVSEEAFSSYVDVVYLYLQQLENRLFSEGLHVLGQPPPPPQMSQYLSAYFGEETLSEAEANVLSAVVMDRSNRVGSSTVVSLEEARASLERTFGSTNNLASDQTIEEALRIGSLLCKNTEEVASILKALNGEYILPEAGGDLLRDGAGVLPTGRNIHALDPYRMPSVTAMARGSEAGAAILEAHRRANNGAWPETVAVNLWGLDAIKTKGESVGIVLHLLGARPVKEGTGRIVRFELIPLKELGRPRIDVLCNMSGIFRDSFQNVVELLDDAFQRAAAAEDEPQELNYVRKHAIAMEQEGVTNPGARLFSNPAGDYGSMVNERVGASTWENGDELGSTWASRNSFSYGRGSERGAARPEVLQSLLATTDRVVQEIDSVEYGLTDIQEYYANTGALRRAAQAARGEGKPPVACSIVEAFERKVKPRELEDVLRMEYRSKLLNPKWATAMANAGSGGAFEISQRMTAMVGWGATVDFREDWTWDQAAETYAFDSEMAEKLRKSNPQAFANVLRRMLEAAGRGMWNANAETLERLKRMYGDMEDELEGVVS